MIFFDKLTYGKTAEKQGLARIICEEIYVISVYIEDNKLYFPKEIHPRINNYILSARKIIIMHLGNKYGSLYSEFMIDGTFNSNQNVIDKKGWDTLKKELREIKSDMEKIFEKIIHK